MFPIFQTAFYNMSSMLGCCILFLFASRKKQFINRESIVGIGSLIVNSYIFGFVIALLLIGIIKLLT